MNVTQEIQATVANCQTPVDIGFTLFTVRPLSFLLCVSFLSACSLSDDSNDAGSTVDINELSQSAAQVTTQNGLGDSVALNSTVTLPDPSPVTQPSDLVSLSIQEVELASRLVTDFSVIDNRLVPTTGWICEDVFQTRRIYYFYPEGVLDSGRKVVVERTLIADNMFNDAQFFWSVNAADSILLTSASTDEQGIMFSTGLQYDMHSIVFTDVTTGMGSVASFNAESVLRGNLVCANFDLQ